MEWQPATVDTVKKIIQDDLAALEDKQTAIFDKYAVEPYQAPILRCGKTESVVVVARRGDEVMAEHAERGSVRQAQSNICGDVPPGLLDDPYPTSPNSAPQAD